MAVTIPTDLTETQLWNLILGTSQDSSQSALATYLGISPVTGTSVQEMLANARGIPIVPSTSRTTQRILFENLQASLSLTEPHTKYSVQELLARAVEAGLGGGSVVRGQQSMLFDGVSSKVDLTNNVSIDAGTYSSGITIGGWIKYNDNGSTHMIASKDNGTTAREWQFSIRADGTLRFIIFVGNSAKTCLTVGFVRRGTWTHVAATYDGTNIKCYIDGVLWKTVAQTGPIDDDNSNLAFGNQLDGTEFFYGNMRGMRLYNAALTDPQINAWSLGTEPPTTNLKLAYDFNDGAATATDSSGNGNTGTLTNTTYSSNIPTVTLSKYALNFQSATGANYVTLSSGITLSGEFTLTGWFKRSGEDVTSTICWLGVSTANTQKVLLRDTANSNVLFVRLTNGGTAVSGDIGYTAALDGKWNFIAINRDSGNNVRASLNGREWVTLGSYIGGDAFTHMDNNSSTSSTKGSRGETKIYDRTLTIAEVRAEMYGTNSSTTNLILHHKYTEATGSVVTDLSASGNNGTLTSVLWSPDLPRAMQYSLSFDGVDDIVDIADSASISLDGNYSLSFWAKPTGLGEGSFSRVFDKEAGGAEYEVNLLGTTQMAIGNNGSSKASGNGYVTLSSWNLYTITYDGANVRFYQGGLSTPFLTVAQTTNPVDSTNNLKIGNRNSTDRTFAGFLTRLKIYKGRVLTGTEYAEMYNNLGTLANESNLSADWRVTAGVGTVLTDFSGNTNTGTITGAVYSLDIPTQLIPSSGVG